MTIPMQELPMAFGGEIELAHVERDLAALWAASASEDRDETPAVLRACAQNLLVLGRSPADLDRARPLAARTTRANPSRILLIAPEPSTEPSGAGPPETRPPGSGGAATRLPEGISARISAFCHRLGGGGRHVCCEEITVLARGAASERLPEAVLPLLLPDMPVYLWLPEAGRPVSTAGPDTTGSPGSEGWHGSRRRAAARRLAAMADGVIWSARMPDDRLRVTAARSRPRGVVDLDWLQILPWRELTAQLFDAPERRLLLDQLERVEVAVAGASIARPGAGWLWIGWLASRLGWEPTQTPADPPAVTGPAAHGATERRLNARGGSVGARVFTVGTEDVAPGELLAARLFPHAASTPLVLERQPMPNPAELCIRQGSDRCVHLGIRDEAMLLAEALGAGGRDLHYESAWEMALRLWPGR